MTIYTAGAWFGCTLSLIALAAPSSARAQATAPARLEVTAADADEESDEQVRDLMRAGVAEYKKKNLEGARQAFTRAWERARRPEIAAALADVEMKLGRYRDAAEHWDRYLQSNPADKADATARFNECRSHVAEVLVDISPAGAALDVDGARMLLSSRGTIWLEPGAHRLAARFEGRTGPEQNVDLIAGQQTALSLSVPPPVAPAAAASSRPTAAPPVVVAAAPAPKMPQDVAPSSFQPRTAVLIGGAALTVAGAAIGVVSLINRSGADSDRKQLLVELRDENPDAPENSICAGSAPPAKCNEVFEKSHAADRARNWALGGFIGAGVFGAATVATYLLWPAPPKPGQGAGVVVVPLADRGSRGVQILGRF